MTVRTPLLVLRRAVREDEDAVRADRLRVHELQGLRLFRVPEEALAALRQAGVDYRLAYLALLLPLVALVLAFAAARFPPPGAGETDEERPPGGGPPAAPEAKGGAGRWELYRDRSLLLVAAIACLGLLAEGEMAPPAGRVAPADRYW